MSDEKIHRLYFGVRYLIGGILTNIILLGFILILGDINFIQAIVIIPMAIIFSFITCAHINKRIMKITEVTSDYVNNRPKIKRFIFRII